MDVRIITISREFGCNGTEVAERLAKKLKFLLVNKRYINESMVKYGLTEEQLESLEESSLQPFNETRKRYIELMNQLILDLAEERPIVLLGRGGQFLFRNHPSAFHVKLIGSIENRVTEIMAQYKLDKVSALKLISEQDRRRDLYISKIFGGDWHDPSLYSLVINMDYFNVSNAVKMISRSIKLAEKNSHVKLEESSETLKDATGSIPHFAHSSEEEFAKLLDFYRIRWLYEPKTFILECDSEGNITSAFTPDFYLPDFDLYIELTTQKQRLVNYKNRKIKRLKELYPNVNIKMIYGKDYKNILRKFGLI
ncbi:cytidylate kinase-like family protein [bacterium]|nr:cytidylate kinase-like family protein [bacterium]